MKKKLLFLLSFSLLLSWTDYDALFAQQTEETSLEPKDEHRKQAMVVATLLSRFHYRNVPFEDSISSVVFDTFLGNLDGNKLYFLKSDIEQLEQFRFLLDDYVKVGGLEVAYGIFEIYKQRVADRIDYSRYLVEKGFDFEVDEYMEVLDERKGWLATIEEQDEAWRKLVKSQALSLKLTGKSWEEVRKLLKERFENQEKALGKYSSDDVFQFFMNSVAETYDPHSTYFSPIASDNFKISMSLSLEGIGARLQSINDYTVVYEITPGGPAFKSKLLHKDDKIIAVAQGDDGEMVDVIGWRLNDVITLIRGEKGSKVRLMLLKALDGPDAIPEEITIVRDKIKLEEQAVSKEVITIDREDRRFKVGVITIPSFYMNFEAFAKGEKDYASTTRDVKRLLNELKQEDHVDGVMIDLRYNGGGSLTEAVNLTGLFIKDGPVVQVKSADGELELGTDQDSTVAYDGPLTVLVNRFSASASEIFAGAIQDYKRGVVVGEQTYGKGTVQNMIGLDHFLPDEEERLGELKLTLAKYYRVTGSATQHQGVTPDIALPSAFSAEEFGESSQPTALPWDRIDPTEFEEVNAISPAIISHLNEKYQERLLQNLSMKKLIEEIQATKERRKMKQISLNENQRQSEQKTEEEGATSPNGGVQIGSELGDSGDGKQSTEITDVYLKEGVDLLADLILKRIG